MDEIKKLKLSGGPDKTVIWIWLDPAGGQLKVEYYDFSEAAQKLFGNDIAYTITIHEMDKLFSIVNQNETSIISWMEQYFKSYFGIKNGLKKIELNLVLKEKVGLNHVIYRPVQNLHRISC